MRDVQKLIESSNFNAEVIDHQTLRIKKLREALNGVWKSREKHGELWALIMNAISDDKRLEEEIPKWNG